MTGVLKNTYGHFEGMNKTSIKTKLHAAQRLMKQASTVADAQQVLKDLTETLLVDQRYTVTPKMAAQIRQLAIKGKSMQAIATHMGISYPTVRKYLRK